MEFLWVFIGIGYVIFKLFKDGDIQFSWKNLNEFILVIIPLVISGIIFSISESNHSIVGMTIGLIIRIAWFIGLFIWSSKPEKKPPAPMEPRYTVQDLQQKFQNNGYPSIDIEMINNLISDPYSPLNHGNVSNVSYGVCYRWMCDKGTWEIDKLSHEEIGAKLGVPLDEIPLDRTMKLGDASLKQTTLAKNRLLSNQGLLYRNFTYFLDKSDEYYIIFNHFVDEYISEHQQHDTP